MNTLVFFNLEINIIVLYGYTTYNIMCLVEIGFKIDFLITVAIAASFVHHRAALYL